MYVKSKDLDLWHVITNGDFQPIEQNLETKLDEVIPFEKPSDDLKKRLAKNNEAKMIDLLVQQYEKFVISEDESIDSAFARFYTILTSLKALDEGYSSKNYVMKFLRALHSKWRAKVISIEKSKDLTSLSLDELIEMRSVRLPEVKTNNTPWRLETSRSSSREEVDSCGDPNHLIGECPKLPKDKNQIALVGGSWSDSGEEDDKKDKEETCLVAQASNGICLRVDLEPDEWIKDSGCSKHLQKALYMMKLGNKSKDKICLATIDENPTL
ncbi:hypothetical protein Tco_0683728 [Tanacetum coccineum]